MLIYANLLEGSNIWWETHLAAQEVAHNDFGLGDGGDGGDGDYGDDGKGDGQILLCGSI